MNEENNFLFYIIIIIIIILSFIIIFNDNKKNLNNELEETHQICPITGFHTNLSVCIEYPQLNEAYIISVNNKRCISLIQESFDKDDHKYEINIENDNIYLYQNDIKKQKLLRCNKYNMNYILKLTNNEIMK